jgi:DNA-binding CsgD family transcriptional regulator
MIEGATLTKREAEIAELLAWGATKKDVANRLFVSERTVENHTRNIFEKIGVTKVNELSAWWFCKHFNISSSLSPLKRNVIATFLLFLVVYQIAQCQFIVRTSRTSAKTTTTRVRSSRRNADDATTIDFFNF